VLRAFPRMRLNIELKPEADGAERAFAGLLRAEEALERVCVGSESDALAGRLHAALPEACHFYPRDALATLVIALRSGQEPPAEERFHVLDMPLYLGDLRLVDAPLLAAAARLGRWVNVWTVDEPDEMRRLVAEGVGGIMTDRPDLLRAVLDERARP
jgi:glycerophosphoryl diester phosphodiesterase